MKTEWAPLLDCYAVNVHIFRLADIKIFETKAIIGQGSMELAHTDLANAIGLKAIAFALRDFPLPIANRLGAWATINSSKEDLLKKVLELIDGFGVDSIYLQVGGRNLNLLKQALQMTKTGGKVMVVGLSTEGRSMDQFNMGLMRYEKMLIDVSSFSYWDEYSEAAISRAGRLITRGKLHPADRITHRFPLGKINEALMWLQKRKKPTRLKS